MREGVYKVKMIATERYLTLRIFIIFIFLAFIFPNTVLADIWFPTPSQNCHFEEEYFKPGSIDPGNYRNIRVVVFGDSELEKRLNANPPGMYTEALKRMGEKGYCVSTDEYCSKNKCNLETTFKLVKTVKFHTEALVYNLLLNAIIIFILILALKKYLNKQLSRVTLIIKLVIATILGYGSDIAGAWIASAILTKTCMSGSFLETKNLDWLCGGFYYKTQDAWEIVLSSPLGIVTLTTAVFIFVSIIFYIILSGILFSEKKSRLLASLAFGFLSNPVWYFIFKLFF